MRAWIFSDLHIDVNARTPWVIPEPRPEHDVAIIAGDICQGLQRGVHWIAEHDLDRKPVIYVPGNHEYYGFDFDSERAAGRAAAAQRPNIHVLDRDTIAIDGVTFVGATLWTVQRYTSNHQYCRNDPRRTRRRVGSCCRGSDRRCCGDDWTSALRQSACVEPIWARWPRFLLAPSEREVPTSERTASPRRPYRGSAAAQRIALREIPLSNATRPRRRRDSTALRLPEPCEPATGDVLVAPLRHDDASAVMVNDHSAFRTDWMPFAGRRESGYGTGGIPFTAAEMTAEKMIVFKR